MPGKVTCYISTNTKQHALKIGAMVQGFRQHGILPSVIEWPNMLPPADTTADLHVIFGHRCKNVIDHCKHHGLDYICIDLGYVGDRDDYCSIGYNGLNGRAEFHNKNSPPDRWNIHRHLLKPWQDGGTDILILGQCRNDANHRDLIDIRQWTRTTQQYLSLISKERVIVRQHPKSRQVRRILRRGGVYPSLLDAFATAKCAVTFNSNAAVEAVLAGVPTVVVDMGSMAWPVTAHGVHKVRGVLPTPDREQWASDLCYAQWNLEEMAKGHAWEHLRRRYG